MSRIGEAAARQKVTVVVEPQNPDSINNLNTIGEALNWLSELKNPQVHLLADTFHMEYTEENTAESITESTASTNTAARSKRRSRKARPRNLCKPEYRNQLNIKSEFFFHLGKPCLLFPLQTRHSFFIRSFPPRASEAGSRQSRPRRAALRRACSRRCRSPRSASPRSRAD